MNFSPFGSPFSASIPNIHQFAAKLSQDVSPSNSFNNSPSEDTITLTNRYTANGIPSFTQHHHATTAQHQQLFAASSKSNGNYPQIYSPMSKRQNFEQQNFDLFAMRSPSNNGENNNKKKDHHYQDKIPQNHQQQPAVLNPWQNLASSSTAVADYLSQLPASTLPLSLHEFLKYSAETLKKDNIIGQSNEVNGTINVHSTTNNNTNSTLSTINTAHLHNNANNVAVKKKKKKKQEKKPKPKPGEIRVSTALDGSTLYSCPECHMALPERTLLEQHLIGHNMERRFVCDICGAALKRKDHLTRHKQSHNPERPFVCSVCLKAFKRKEQLTLHFVIHSGEKRHVCNECGKGFYRKDHLRKHTRSHIARRVKAELSQQGGLHGISP